MTLKAVRLNKDSTVPGQYIHLRNSKFHSVPSTTPLSSPSIALSSMSDNSLALSWKIGSIFRTLGFERGPISFVSQLKSLSFMIPIGRLLTNHDPSQLPMRLAYPK